MLRLLPTAPSDLGKKGEMSKHSPALDRMTNDSGDLRFYTSNDGARTYLRVWEGDSETAPTGSGRWYQVTAEIEAVPHEPHTKKR